MTNKRSKGPMTNGMETHATYRRDSSNQKDGGDTYKGSSNKTLGLDHLTCRQESECSAR